MHRSKILRRTEGTWRKRGCNERRWSCGAVAVICILLQAKAMVKIRVSGSNQDFPGCAPCSIILTKGLVLSSGSKMRIDKVRESEPHVGAEPHMGWVAALWEDCLGAGISDGLWCRQRVIKGINRWGAHVSRRESAPSWELWFSVDADRGHRMNIGSCSHTCYPACIWKEI